MNMDIATIQYTTQRGEDRAPNTYAQNAAPKTSDPVKPISEQDVAGVDDAINPDEAKATEPQDKSAAPKKPAAPDISVMLRQIAGAMTTVEVEHDDDLGSYVFRAIDKETGDIIKEWPRSVTTPHPDSYALQSSSDPIAGSVVNQIA